MSSTGARHGFKTPPSPAVEAHNRPRRHPFDRPDMELIVHLQAWER